MKADFALDYDVLTVEQPHKLYMMARLTSGAAPDHQSRRPLNISLVIDRSGSMAGDKLSYTRQAAQFLVQNLGVKDKLSIVLYNENVETLLPPDSVIHKDAIGQRLNQIKASGMTNLSGGWLQGCGLVEENLNADILNRVILMSDGLANRGITNATQLVTMARQKREQHITTTTMGLGADFNEDLMVAIADAGGGAFYFIETPEAAPLIFQEELRGLLSVVGQNLTVSLDLTSYITHVNQLNAYNMHTNGERVSFSLGDVFGDEVKTLLLELSIPALKDVGHKQIATLIFEYDEIDETSTQHQTMQMPVIVNVAPGTDDPMPANPEVRQSVLLLQAARARREAVSAADKGEFDRASQILKHAADAIDQSRIGSTELNEEQKALLQQSDEIQRGSAFYDSYNRKTMSTQALYTLTDRHESTQLLRTRELERQGNGVPIEVNKKEGVTPTFITLGDHTIPLKPDLIRVGRAPQNEIIINAKNVSRFHCQIKREGDKLILEDLGSTNGTYLNDSLLKQPQALSVGDVARVGHENIVFHDHG